MISFQARSLANANYYATGFTLDVKSFFFLHNIEYVFVRSRRFQTRAIRILENISSINNKQFDNIWINESKTDFIRLWLISDNMTLSDQLELLAML